MDHLMCECGDLQLDLDARVAYVAGTRLILTFAEFELLHRLASDPGRAFGREELRPAGTRSTTLRGVDASIVRLRRKLAGARSFAIETVPHVGYRCWSISADTCPGMESPSSFARIAR